MTHSIVRQSDLVLSVVGGARHGKTISISSAKCVLAFDDDSPGATRQTRCAILRGKAGVSIRNLDKKVSFNGHFSPTHWLKEGDLIQFPNSVALRVTHLGAFDDEVELCATVEQGSFPEEAAFQPTNGNSSSFEQDQSEIPEETQAGSLNHWTNEVQGNEVQANEVQPLEPIEVKRITELVDNRFVEIEKRIEMLTEQISSLVTLATTGQFSSRKLNEEEWKSYSSSNDENQDVQIPAQIPASEPSTEANLKSNWFSGSDTSEAWNSTGFQANEILPNRDPNSGFNPSAEFESVQPVQEEQGSAIDYAGLTSRFSQALQETETPLLTPLRRENCVEDRSIRDNVEIEHAESELTEAKSFSEIEPSQTNFGKSGSFRAATDALEQFQTSAQVNTDVKPSSVSNDHQEESFSSAATATPTTDEALDALLKRLYQDQESGNSAIHDVTDSTSIAEKKSDSWSVPGEREETRNVFSGQTNDKNLTDNGNTSYAEMKFGYDLGSDSTSGAAEFSAARLIEPQNETVTSGLSNDFSRVALEPTIEPVSNQPAGIVPEPVPASGNSAIMDLLARLKAEGAWDDSDDQTATETSPSLESTPAELEAPGSGKILSEGYFANESTLESAADETGIACDQSASEISELDATPLVMETAVEEEEEVPVSADSVEDYMSQLLARMQKKRGDSEPTVKKTVEKSSKDDEARATALAKTTGQELMTAEEYVPKQKAQKIHSFDTMREIANTTARTAVAYSDLDRRRTKGYMQIIIALGALVMAGYYFLFLSEVQGDTSFFVGCICVTISLAAGYLAFRSLTGLKNLKKK